MELELEPTSFQEPKPEPAQPSQEYEELGEIEVERPETIPEPGRPRGAMPTVSIETEGGGLAFLKFESPFVSPEGHAILPALFLDGAGNPVRIRIRVAMDEERS
jgi:hypothetical protein